MTLTPFIVIWMVLAAIVLGLALIRTVAGLHEDDNIHLAAGEDQMIPGQLAFYNLLDRIDRWGKSLTIATVAIGLCLAVVYVYQTAPR